MTKKEAAIAYAANGWKVFPCSPNTKIPIAGTHGVRDATSDVSAVAEWWTNTPDANIGLACGAASGVYVVDIDIHADKGVNGFDSVRASGKTLPDTLKQRTPSGGMHLLYKCEGERPANKNGYLRGVDIRGDGYYIVVAPSSIDGRQYEWVDVNAKPTEYPEDFKPTKSIAVNSVFTAIPPACTAHSTPAIDRARAYLDKIPGAVEGAGGHNTLYWVAQVLVNGFRLSDSDAEELMWSEFNPRCVPPWPRNPSTEKEFRHKISDAHAKPNAEACSIYDAVGDYDAVEEFDFDKCIADVRALLAPKVTTQATARTITKSEAQLNDLLRPEGLVGDIASWMNETAGCYQPLFSLGAALTLCGAIFGRKVCDESNGRTNIFCMGVGHSSSGKDHPGDCINKILTAAGAQSVLMGRMTSDSAIEKALSISPTKLAVMDEVGHFFSNINKAGEGASYLKTIKPTLMELFSSAHKTYIGKEKASGNPPIIEQPCMCLWGVTAPQKLYSGMTIEELQDGWIARNLIFISETRPEYVMKPSSDVPASIVATVSAWINRSMNTASVISASPGIVQKPFVVPMDQNARVIFDRYSHKAHEAMIKAHDRGDKTEYLWGKAFQNARRIALIIACGREYEGPVIGKYEAEYGCNLVDLLIRNAAISISENVSENRFEEEKNRIRKTIESAGRKGMSQNEVTRRTQWVKGKQARNEYLSDLADAGHIVRSEEDRKWYSRTAWEEKELEKGVDHVE